MIVVLVILWKRYKIKPDYQENKFNPADLNTSNYNSNMILRKVASTEFDAKVFENYLAGIDPKMTPEFNQSIGINKDGLQVNNGQDISYIAKFLDDENDITQKYNTITSKSYSLNRTIHDNTCFDDDEILEDKLLAEDTQIAKEVIRQPNII